tara:strand:+ start:3205 stop:4233 length:1029 start_codon:yes stop_codon:yes gene_type:complete
MVLNSKSQVAKDLEVIRNYQKEGPKTSVYAFQQGNVGEEIAETMAQMSEEDRNAMYGGAFCGELIEGVPNHIEAECEKGSTFYGKNNSFIVMGRDRPGALDSGYGGDGETQAGMIDLSVGRKPYDSTLNVNPDFHMDSARIYISQKSDIDSLEYFDLVEGPSTPSVSRDSAVGIKADVIRIVGRKNIRLTTEYQVKNSFEGMIESVGGIDLIAGNSTEGHMDVQPMVKGNNLIACFEELAEQVQNLNIILSGFMENQMKFNKKVQKHSHHGAFYGLKGLPDFEVILAGAKLGIDMFTKTKKDQLAHKFNLTDWSARYLKPSGHKDGDPDVKTYICSRYNNVN